MFDAGLCAAANFSIPWGAGINTTRTIAAGDTLTWVLNVDSDFHTINSGIRPVRFDALHGVALTDIDLPSVMHAQNADNVIASGLLSPGQTFSLQFPSPIVANFFDTLSSATLVLIVQGMDAAVLRLLAILAL
jgi:hypothetical protein